MRTLSSQLVSVLIKYSNALFHGVVVLLIICMRVGRDVSLLKMGDLVPSFGRWTDWTTITYKESKTFKRNTVGLKRRICLTRCD